MIEKEIFAHCKKQHKKMRKLAFGSWQTLKNVI
jgi:hypothetical protein